MPMPWHTLAPRGLCPQMLPPKNLRKALRRQPSCCDREWITSNMSYIIVEWTGGNIDYNTGPGGISLQLRLRGFIGFCTLGILFSHRSQIRQNTSLQNASSSISSVTKSHKSLQQISANHLRRPVHSPRSSRRTSRASLVHTPRSPRCPWNMSASHQPCLGGCLASWAVVNPTCFNVFKHPTIYDNILQYTIILYYNIW